MQWLKENDLQWVNSFHVIRRRGTWYNIIVRKWYELDGFITHPQDRKHMLKKIKVVGTIYSDHNAVCMTLHKSIARNVARRNRREDVPKPRRNINWQKLWVTENDEKYRDQTKELIKDDNQQLS